MAIEMLMATPLAMTGRLPMQRGHLPEWVYPLYLACLVDPRCIRADAISESLSSISESLSSIDESLRSTRNIRACCCSRRALLSSIIPIGVLQYVHCTEIIL